MCRFISIRPFTLRWLFWALLGLLSDSALADGGFYTYSNHNAVVRVSIDGGPVPVCASCASEGLCWWAPSNQTVVSYTSSGNASSPSCDFVYRQGTSQTNLYWNYRPSGTFTGCPSGQQFDPTASSTNYCKVHNSCVSGLAVAGSEYPVIDPGQSGDGHQVTFCSSDFDHCQMTAWESLAFSYCPDNSTSCPPVIYKRSFATQTGQQCSSGSGPPPLPDPSCSGGMQLLGGLCSCPAGARVQGGVCRQNIDCSSGYHRVSDSCIADACPAGEIIQDNKCIPDPRSSIKNTNPAPGEPATACAAGRHYDTSLSSCVANTSADGGTSGSPGTPGNPNTGAGGSGGGLPGESGSAGSSDCAQPPVCSGDAVQCALLTQVWRNHCETVPANVIAEHPVPPIETVDVSSSALSALNGSPAVVLGNTCPQDISFNVSGRQFSLSWQPVCQYATTIRPVLLALGALHALFIVAGASRRND